MSGSINNHIRRGNYWPITESFLFAAQKIIIMGMITRRSTLCYIDYSVYTRLMRIYRACERKHSEKCILHFVRLGFQMPQLKCVAVFCVR